MHPSLRIGKVGILVLLTHPLAIPFSVAFPIGAFYAYTLFLYPCGFTTTLPLTLAFKNVRTRLLQCRKPPISLSELDGVYQALLEHLWYILAIPPRPELAVLISLNTEANRPPSG